jgi:DNA modification methylase
MLINTEYTPKINTITCGNCLEVIQTIPDNSIDMILTSPPYFNAREYSKYKSYTEYLSFLNDIFEKVYSKIKPAGILVLNLSCVIEARASRSKESKRLPIPFDVCSTLSKKWTFLDDIIWVKPDGASSRAIKFAHHRRPVAYKTFNVSEYLLVFSKPGCLLDKSIRSHSLDVIKKSKVSDGYERTNIWKINPERNKHPAPFPLELATKAISYYSFCGDTILDMFMGSGTTAIACIETGRNYIGIEIQEKYCQIAKDRINALRSYIKH